MDRYSSYQPNRPYTGKKPCGGQKPKYKESEVEKAKAKAKSLFESAGDFRSSWVSEKADKDLPDFADKLGKAMADNGLTSSKIRSVYGEIKRIQAKTFEAAQSSFFILKPKVAYAVGREPQTVGLQLFKLLFDNACPYVKNNGTYVNFCNLMEAVLAYHKYYVDPNKNK